VLLFSFICLFFASNAELLNASLGIFWEKSAICNSNFERLHGSKLFLFQFHFHLINFFYIFSRMLALNLIWTSLLWRNGFKWMWVSKDLLIRYIFVFVISEKVLKCYCTDKYPETRYYRGTWRLVCWFDFTLFLTLDRFKQRCRYRPSEVSI